MNKAIQQLYKMPEKGARRILGLMSGTSLDGLDMALCHIEGYGTGTKVVLEQFETAPYPESYKVDLRSVFSRGQVDLQKLTVLNALTGRLHAKLILDILEKWGVKPQEVDCIASHGQTIYHAPQRLHKLTDYPDATLQIGDGDHIAVETGVITISDFRQKHIAAGGEGAPLALYGDYILFSSPEENRALLNIGGITNFTFIPRAGMQEAVICTDAGPGNTLIDALCRKYFNAPFDAEGKYARAGKPIIPLLNALLENPFFREEPPKTTGPELFNLSCIGQAMERLGIANAEPVDLIHTASLLTVRSAAGLLKKAGAGRPFTVYVSGGGCHNRFLMEELQKELPLHGIHLTEKLGIGADAKEAILFALLANETICGSVVNTYAGPAVTMGKISLPF